MVRKVNEESCLLHLMLLCHGRRTGWVTQGDPPQSTRPRCPRCKGKVRLHRTRALSVLDYRCLACNKVFNCWTGTPFQGTHRKPSQLVKLIIGTAWRVPSAEVGKDQRVATCMADQRPPAPGMPGLATALRQAGEQGGYQVNGVSLKDLTDEFPPWEFTLWLPRCGQG